MLVYDITNAKSFDNIQKWLRNIDEHANEDVEKLIVGNKCDMEDRRIIPTTSLSNIPCNRYIVGMSRLYTPLYLALLAVCFTQSFYPIFMLVAMLVRQSRL